MMLVLLFNSLLFIEIAKGLKLIVPIEFNTASPLWQTLISTKSSNKNLEMFAIINPNAAPITSLDTQYQTLMNSLTNSKIKILGNIDTTQCTKTLSTLKTQVDNWISYYGTNLYGLYFNDLKSQSSCISLASDLTTYVHSKQKKAFGKQTDATFTGFNGILDVVVSESSTYPTLATTSDSRTSAGALINSQSLDSSRLSTICAVADFVFVTDSTGVNPYTDLGTQFSTVASTTNGLYFNPADNSCASSCATGRVADAVFKECVVQIQKIDFNSTNSTNDSESGSFILMVSLGLLFGISIAGLLMCFAHKITGVSIKNLKARPMKRRTE